MTKLSKLIEQKRRKSRSVLRQSLQTFIARKRRALSETKDLRECEALSKEISAAHALAAREEISLQ